MPRKPKPPPDNPEQFKRFIDMAREVEADESPEALDKAFDRVIARSQREVREKEPPDRLAASRKRRKG
jgi:hypothetical protein